MFKMKITETNIYKFTVLNIHNNNDNEY